MGGRPGTPPSDGSALSGSVREAGRRIAPAGVTRGTRAPAHALPGLRFDSAQQLHGGTEGRLEVGRRIVADRPRDQRRDPDLRECFGTSRDLVGARVRWNGAVNRGDLDLVRITTHRVAVPTE